MSNLALYLSYAVSLYAVLAIAFLISENRRPQATLAWMLIFVFAPGIGVLIYLFFGRDRKAFSRQTKLLMHELESDAVPLLSPMLTRQDDQIARLESESALRARLMKLVRSNSQSALTTRNRAEILQNASEFYPRLIDDMRAARHSIHHQYFIWGADEFTETLKDVLCAKAQANVEVRLLYDPLGSFAHLNRSYLRQMREAGVRISPTSPLWRLHTISYRNHRKITIIDGQIGYTGGMNIGREHLSGGRDFDFWRDTQLRVVGDAVALLQAVFMVDWYNAVKENLFAPAYFPSDRPQARTPGIPVQILTSGPDSQWAAIRQLYFAMITGAQRHVYIQSPFFLPDATIAEALRAAALAGIDVKVMVSAHASGNKLPEWAGNTFMANIVASGVRVFLYQRGYLHAKTISIDSEICSIGSANIDIRSFSINYEINAVLYDKRSTAKLEEDFARDLIECVEFDATTYEARHPAIRFRDSLARLLSPLL